jgi:hypothetical protein
LQVKLLDSRSERTPSAVLAGELLPFGFSAFDLAGIHVAVTSSTAHDAAWLNAAVADERRRDGATDRLPARRHEA